MPNARARPRVARSGLLVDAIARFVALTAAMYLTRGIVWYSSLPGADAIENRNALFVDIDAAAGRMQYRQGCHTLSFHNILLQLPTSGFQKRRA